MFNYRRHLGKWAFRTRFGGSFRNNNDESDSSYRYSLRYSHLITAGLERNNVIQKWFEVHYGFEFFHGYNYDRNTSESDLYNSYSFSDRETDINEQFVPNSRPRRHSGCFPARPCPQHGRAYDSKHDPKGKEDISNAF